MLSRSKLKLFFKFIYFERGRVSTSWIGAEIEGDRIPSRLHAVSTEPDMGLKPTNCEIVT